MYGLWANFFDNPILVRELRRRMRGKALLYSIVAYLFLMTLATIGVMVTYAPGAFERPSTETLQRMKETGETIFQAITTIQVLLVLIIAPTITAGLTTGEKERQTFDFLRVTTISRWMYVVGCFLSTLFYVGLALLCALPLQAVTFLYGGVSLGNVLGAFVLLLSASALLSAFGLFISSVVEKTRTAQGIVIFMVFALLFLGVILVQSYQAIFVGATSMLPAAAEGLYLAGLLVPSWLLVPAGLAGLALFFLLLAVRKLFESDDARALSYWQFTVTFLVLNGIFLGVIAANQFANEIVEWAFLSFGYVMLLGGVLIFSIGRMEVGDEMWHMKRVVKPLRPIDPTLPFLALIGLIWFMLVGSLPKLSAAPQFGAEVVRGFQYLSASSFFCLVMVGRFSTAFLSSSAAAFRYTLGILLGLIFVLPLFVAGASEILPLDILWQPLSALSPLAFITADVAGSTTGAFAPIVASGAYVFVGMLFGIVGEIRRYQRWKNFDYHYDMPAR